MTLNISDPLALLAYQSGLSDPILKEAAAEAADDLTSSQVAYKIGDPVPIVFCRRVNNVGGVMVSPGATEGRYENDGTTNALTVSLHLVLSEGQLPTIPIKDVFAGPCRQGTWDQTYNRRAGTWFPGNFITTVAEKTPWSCPYYCGTSGRYANMTTLSYVNTFPDGSDRWEQQVHVFVREGMQVTRIIDSTFGPSNNVIDLALYLMNQSGRIPSTLINNAKMLAAANFCQTNGFFYNGVFQESSNLDEWLEQIGNDFLLRLVESGGKFAFKPRLPVNGDHTIKTTAISWEFTFTEDHLLPDGFEIEYVSLADRQPVCLQMMWRQQPDSDIGFPRTTEVRYTGEAETGPFEQYDLSQFCASETHAVKVGAFRLARRKYITHTLRLNVRPSSYNTILELGDIVRVRLRRETATTALGYHDFLYEVERIEKTASGACVFDLTHFPIDSQGRSLVALEVAAATAPGVTISAGRSDYACDVNSSSDNTPLGGGGTNYPASGGSFDPPTQAATTVSLASPSEPTWPTGGRSPIGTNVGQPANQPSGGQTPNGDWANPADPLEQDSPGYEPNYITGMTGSNGEPQVGDELAISESNTGCPGAQVCWAKLVAGTNEVVEVSGCQTEPIAGAYKLSSLDENDIGYYISVIVRCPDPSTSTGYGEPRTLGTTKPVKCAPAPAIQGGNISGTTPPAGNTAGGTWTLQRSAGTVETYNTVFPPLTPCTTFTTLGVGASTLYTYNDVKSVAFSQDTGPCGPNSFNWTLTFTNNTTVTVTPLSATNGFRNVNHTYTVSWNGPGAVAWEVPCA